VIRINQIKLRYNHSNEDLLHKIINILKIKKEEIIEYSVVKRSIDAREKPDFKYVYSVNVTLKNDNKVKKSIFNQNVYITEKEYYNFVPCGEKIMNSRPVIAGFGPAGIFCGYFLAKHGYKPIIIERGKCVEERQKDVLKFWEENVLNTESNVQFGEGGAGTFSDGKLNTLVKDKMYRNRLVLETLVEFGAKESILYDNKPHIGTDKLAEIVVKMRNAIISLGGEVRFNSKLTNISVENGYLKGIEVNNNEIIDTENLVLAIGHSARDTFKMLYDNKVNMEAKSFAVGVRIEHPQIIIDENMYGSDHNAFENIEAADYKVTYTASNERGVYSFCMCPGGYVVNASSENGRIAVNGMSYSKRDGVNANSAIIVSVNPSDFGSTSPLGAVEFQRNLEEKAYIEGKGNIPIQLFGDFCENRISKELKSIKPQIKGKYEFGNIRNILPNEVCDSLEEGIKYFGNKIKGFDSPDAVLSAVESRTSSPVRISRDEEFYANIKGIYPCGEGAGYAGGITSAAMDGIRVFEAIAKSYKSIV